MKPTSVAILVLFLAASCTTKKELAYLGNLPETGGEATFTMNIPNYLLQPRDILYITIKAMTPEGFITDFLSVNRGSSNANLLQTESGGYIYGFDISQEGNISLPAVGKIKVTGLTLEEAKKAIEKESEKVFRNATVECKLLSYKFTVIGEVRNPGTFVNYNNNLTVLEAIGRAGGLTDFGKRDRVLVVRSVEKGTKTFMLSLRDKRLLSSEGYFLLPNDVVIVQEGTRKIFNINLPTFSFILVSLTSTITSTVLLLDYLRR